MADSKKTWRCFHCDEVLTDEHSAKMHFGMDQCSDPACLIKMGAEKSLLVALRRAEAELQDAWFAIHNESTEAAKAYYAQQSRHGDQLRAAEELGFERGMADSAKFMREVEKANVAYVDANTGLIAVNSLLLDALKHARDQIRHPDQLIDEAIARAEGRS